MAVNVKKYNPGFLTDQELASAFCIRLHEFDSLLESLHLCTGSSNVHTLVIGPRGSGKTHLLLRVLAHVRQDAAWAGIFPIVFAEENYEVATCGEFWLECLNRLSDQAPARDRNALRLSYNEIQATPDDLTLQDRCLGALLDFADRRGQRLLLIVERLHALFGNMADPHAGWHLRHTLQTEPRIIWLGSAARRFAEIDSSQHALYDFFRVVTLHPLDTRACTRLWRTVSGREDAPRMIRSLEILTGGNPRWLTIMARCSAGRPFRELMGSVLDLVDEHTEYFKSHLEALSPQERRGYLALARIWKPATAREIAAQTRLSTNHCSALLKRLVQFGAVAIEEGNAYRQRYHLTERLYSLYYLLRRGGAAAEPVRALIDFMVGLYAPSKLSDTLASLSRDADVLSARIAERLREVAFDEALSLMQAGATPKDYDLFGYAMHCLNAGGYPTLDGGAPALRPEPRPLRPRPLRRTDRAVRHARRTAMRHSGARAASQGGSARPTRRLSGRSGCLQPGARAQALQGKTRTGLFRSLSRLSAGRAPWAMPAAGGRAGRFRSDNQGLRSISATGRSPHRHACRDWKGRSVVSRSSGRRDRIGGLARGPGQRPNEASHPADGFRRSGHSSGPRPESDSGIARSRLAFAFDYRFATRTWTEASSRQGNGRSRGRRSARVGDAERLAAAESRRAACTGCNAD